MNRSKIINALKVVVIILLVMAITFLVLVQWRSDVIVRKVAGLIQHQMEDSLRYDEISLEWFRYFPNAALELNGLHIGKTEEPLISNGNVAVVLRIFPLLREKVIINKLLISDSHINITKQKGKWTYDIFKKQKVQSTIQNADIADSIATRGWETLIRKLELQNSTIFYDNGDGTKFSLEVDEGIIAGNLSGELLDAELDIEAKLTGLDMSAYKQSEPFPFELKGKYKYDSKLGHQEIKNWKIHNEGLAMDVNGNIRKEEGDKRWMDIHFSWENADPGAIKSLMPAQDIKNWNEYELEGKYSGKLDVKGISSKNETPQIILASELEKGSVKFPGDGGQLKNMLLNIAYDNGASGSKSKSYLRANLRNGSFQGNDLTADIRINNMSQPVMDLQMKGALPASILNMFLDSASWNFKEGRFDIDHYGIKNLLIKSISTKTFIEKSAGKLTAEKVRFHFSGDDMVIDNGDMRLDENGNMKLKMDEFTWNKAKGENIVGDLLFSGDNVAFEVQGNHSRGEITGKGSLAGLGSKPVLNADWKGKGLEIKEVLSSFENFDQTFITSENLNGKADIWTHTTIPYDANGNILEKEILVRSAIEIKDGELKDLKTLEDFSKYIHLDDLRDIKFNGLRNYMKIEDGKVYLPVMFIQSSAINMSINGVHSFNHDILYNLKINAGQAAANKLKKNDPLKKLKPARKSGWINLYYILSGTVENVKYEQDQKQVISSFEQSTKLKEDLRNYLVDRFGHDVYWLEPNEWEDIPEYK